MTVTSVQGIRPGTTALGSFLLFGLLWGLFAAALPSIRVQTGATDAQLGTALLCVGLAAVPAMLVTGRLLDRWGSATLHASTALFALTAALPAFATSVPQLIVALLLFGAASGAMDVAVNNAAAAVEANEGRRLMNKAHAFFSLALLCGSVLQGLNRGLGLPTSVSLLAAGGLIIGVLVVFGRRARTYHVTGPRRRRRVRVSGLMVLAGALLAIAFAIESGLQQWSAVYLEAALDAAPFLSSLGPGVFAGAMVAGRLFGHALGTRWSDVRIMVTSGAVTTAGTAGTALAPYPALALTALMIAGAGIAIAAPTIYGVVGRNAPPGERGATIGVVTSIAYTGLIAGPAVVGYVAEATTLRTAFGTMAILALVLTGSATALGRATRQQLSPTDGDFTGPKGGGEPANPSAGG